MDIPFPTSPRDLKHYAVPAMLESAAIIAAPPLSRWRINSYVSCALHMLYLVQGTTYHLFSSSPFVQTLVVGVMLFLGPGMNAADLGLGAGGNRPKEIPTVDKVNVLTTTLLCASSFFGGSINNQIGPKYSAMLGASGYPLYIGSLWCVDAASHHKRICQC